MYKTEGWRRMAGPEADDGWEFPTLTIDNHREILILILAFLSIKWGEKFMLPWSRWAVVKLHKKITNEQEHSKL